MAGSERKSRFKRMHEENLAKENKRIENTSTLTDELVKNTTNLAEIDKAAEDRPKESMSVIEDLCEKTDVEKEIYVQEEIAAGPEVRAEIPTAEVMKTSAALEDDYIYDKNGNIKLKTDGTPARKPGRKKVKDGSYIKLSISMPKDMYDAVHDYLSLYRENMTEYVLSLVAKDVNENYENNMNKIEASKADPTRITIKRRKFS